MTQFASKVSCVDCKYGQYVRRTNHSTGGFFWGCDRFPNCRSTQDYEAIDERTGGWSQHHQDMAALKKATGEILPISETRYTYAQLYEPVGHPDQLQAAIQILQSAGRKVEQLPGNRFALHIPYENRGYWGRHSPLTPATIMAMASAIVVGRGVEHPAQQLISKSICDKCKKGMMILHTKKGTREQYWGCSHSPLCSNSKPKEAIEPNLPADKCRLQIRAKDWITRANAMEIVDKLVPDLEKEADLELMRRGLGPLRGTPDIFESYARRQAYDEAWDSMPDADFMN